MTDLDRRSFLKTGAAVAGGAAIAGALPGLPGGAAPGRLHGPPSPTRWCRSPTCATGSCASRCRRASSTGRSSRAAEAPGSRSTTAPCCPGGTTAWPPSRDGGQRRAGPQPRGELRRAPTCGAGHGTPVYDSAALGGTIDGPRDPRRPGRARRHELAGTQMNCSGGRMPWGAWITCEETVNGPDVADDFTRTPIRGNRPGSDTYIQNPTQKPHGSSSRSRSTGQATASRSRTPDGSPTRRSRSTPRRLALPHRGQFRLPLGLLPLRTRRATRCRSVASQDGGRLWMLKVRRGQRGPGRRAAGRRTYDVEWVEIDDPWFDVAPPAPGRTPMHQRRGNPLRRRPGPGPGAAKFSRLEGAVYDGGLRLLHVDPGWRRRR